MNRPANVLSLLLAAQLLLVALVFWPESNDDTNTAETPLLSMVADDIERVTVSASDNVVVLAKKAGSWQMPEYHNLPADPATVERALTGLPSLSRGWPVANSPAAATRFEVSDDNFQRRVEYFAGGADSTTAVLYLGTSPGFRKVHTRIDSEDDVFAVEFNAFELPATASEWLDQTLLQVTDIQFVKGLDYELVLEGEQWMSTDGGAPDQSAVDNLINGLTSLRVTAAADIAIASIFDEMKVPPTITATTLEGEFEFRLFEIEEAYYIQRGDIPVYFSLSALDYDRLNSINAVALFPTAETEDAPNETD